MEDMIESVSLWYHQVSRNHRDTELRPLVLHSGFSQKNVFFLGIYKQLINIKFTPFLIYVFLLLISDSNGAQLIVPRTLQTSRIHQI